MSGKGLTQVSEGQPKGREGEPCSPGSSLPDPCPLSPQWDLVCSNRALRQLAQSLYMVGVLLGAMVFGYLADRSVLGRAKGPGWAPGLGWVHGNQVGSRPYHPGAGLRTYGASLVIPHRSSKDQGKRSSPYPAWHHQSSGPLLLFSPPSPHRLGRRKVLILNYLQTAVSGTCAAFAPNFPVYCAFRLLSGMSLASIALNCMTLSEGCWEGRAGPHPLTSDHPTQQPLSSFLSRLPPPRSCRSHS